jgi:hypothetical protein
MLLVLREAMVLGCLGCHVRGDVLHELALPDSVNHHAQFAPVGVVLRTAAVIFACYAADLAARGVLSEHM